MTAIEILMKRADIPEEEASYYIDLAETRVRLFLKLDKCSDLSQYIFGISDIATLLYQIDQSVKQTKQTLGYSSKSFSEGGVSKSETGMVGSDIRAKYEAEIENVLDNLDGSAGRWNFL